MSTQKQQILIAGGGLVGLPLALALAGLGLDIAVIEREPPTRQHMPEFDGRVSAIAIGSKHLFENLGVWKYLAPHAEPIRDIHVSEQHTRFFLHYMAQDVGEQHFGYIAENRYIRLALQQAIVNQPNITLYAPDEVTDYQETSAHVIATLKSGAEIQARLLVAADGKFSRLREMARIGAMQYSYEQTAIVCTIAHTQPHHGLAQERFLPAGPFAVLPMPGNHSSLVWVEPEARAPVYLGMDDAALVREITHRVGDYLGNITLCGPRHTYPLGVVHADRYAQGHLVLVGDAAHGIHPLAGQGANLGWRDVAVLAEIIQQQIALGLDIAAPDALAHYSRWRRSDNLAMLAMTDALNRGFGTTLLPVALARRGGMALVAALPPLKRYFMRHAMGVVGKTPPLLKAHSAS